MAASQLSENYALSELIAAGNAMLSESGREPWRAAEIEKKVKRAFADGKRNPRVVPARQPADKGSTASALPYRQGEARAKVRPSDEPPPDWEEASQPSPENETDEGPITSSTSSPRTDGQQGADESHTSELKPKPEPRS